MTEQTKVALERFFGMSTWDTFNPNDEDRFYDFVAIAFKNGDKSISLKEMEEIAMAKEEGALSDYKQERLGRCDGLFKDGMLLIGKYLNLQ